MVHTSLKEHLRHEQAFFTHKVLLDEHNKKLLNSIFFAIALSAKEISHLLSKPALLNILGQTGFTNVQGESVQKLDEITNTIFIENLKATGAVCALGSEEEESFVLVPSEDSKGRFVVFFDPLDGSSNIDVNVSVGTIFSIFYLAENLAITEENLLQAGKSQVAAGYVTYGAACILVYSAGNGVHAFTLNTDKTKASEASDDFLLSHKDMLIPESGKYYSANLGNYHKWQEEDQKAITAFQQKASLRYVGSLIADFHRTLICGGIFSYPADKTTKKGKLRLLYEVAPLSFIIEQAKGKAFDGACVRILDKKPQQLHERTAFLFGSPLDVDLYLSHFNTNPQ